MTLTGSINDRFSPIVSISVGPAEESLQPMDALLDTGFNGQLAISEGRFSSYGMRNRYFRGYNTMKGPVNFVACSVFVSWDGESIEMVEAIIADTDAVGTRLLTGLRLDIRFAEQGNFTLSDSAM